MFIGRLIMINIRGHLFVSKLSGDRRNKRRHQSNENWKYIIYVGFSWVRNQVGQGRFATLKGFIINYKEMGASSDVTVGLTARKEEITGSDQLQGPTRGTITPRITDTQRKFKRFIQAVNSVLIWLTSGSGRDRKAPCVVEEDIWRL